MRKLAPGQVSACTSECKGRAALLRVEAKLGLPFKENEEPAKPALDVVAIWDTGASGSAITRRTAEDLGLEPTGMVKTSTAAGERDTYTYLVSLFLPNRVCIASLRVSEQVLKDLDMLIGMDVIGNGDFAVTNHSGITVWTYRYPSIQRIDFVKALSPKSSPKSPRIGRNSLCPCGSGKKYKRCCGRR